MSIIKSEEDLNNLRYSCRILMSCHAHLEKMLKDGVSTGDLNRAAISFGKKYDAVPNFLGYDVDGAVYDYAITVSINEEVVHGLANDEKIIRDGDVVKIDMGFIYKGMHSDAAKTYIVGGSTPEIRKLVDVTYQALMKGIEQVKHGVRVGDIGYAINKIAIKNGYGNVWQMGGHGLGYLLHDDPFISHIGKKGKGSRLWKNKVIAIEPMFTLGSGKVEVDSKDGWTARTVDGSIACHWEHDILVTETGCEVLTDIKEKDLLD